MKLTQSTGAISRSGAARVARSFNLALLIAAASMLGACAAIPTSGAVREGAEISNVSTNDFLYFSPYEPPIDGSIGDIMAGFLSAGTGPQNDYAVARMYLANNLKSTWLPNQQVVIVDTAPETTVDESLNTATVRVHAQAFVDGSGRLMPEPAATNSEFKFEFIRENGQWRIQSAPNLTIISRPVFDVVFKDFELYFLDSQKRYLVPDVRWFPSRASTATRLVNALIEGPGVWLQGAVKNPLPAGTKLAIDAVTITDGVAAVDFNSKVLTASNSTRAQIQAQLKATLGQISGVRTVQISVDRNVQDFSGFTPWSVPMLSLTPVVLTADSLAHLSGTSTTAIDGTKNLVQHLKPHDFAITSQNNWVAVLAKDGLYQASLVGLGAEPTLVDSRKNLLAPAYDRQGWLWSIDSGNNPTIRVFDQSDGSSIVLSSFFAKKKVLSFALSPEGARLAAVVKNQKGTEVLQFGVMRNKNGLPLKLSGEAKVSTMAANPVSVSWLGESTLGFVSADSNGWAQPIEAVIGGFENSLAGLSEAQNFIGAHATDARFALTKSGDLMQFRGSNWTRVQSGVLKVHYPN